MVEKNIKPILVGIAGGSCSGKTTFAELLYKELGTQKSCLLKQDNYYRDQSKNFDHDGGAVNFDHPESLDFKLLAEQLTQIKAHETIQVPIYDFKKHKRTVQTITEETKPVIIIEGTLILHAEPVFHLLDLSIFIDASEELRFERRLLRDVEERGRTPDGVRHQFFKQVGPMHDQFVAPSGSRAKYQITPDTFDQAFTKVCVEIYALLGKL